MNNDMINPKPPGALESTLGTTAQDNNIFKVKGSLVSTSACIVGDHAESERSQSECMEKQNKVEEE